MGSVGFGIERIGLIGVRVPAVALSIVLAFTIFCVYGVAQLKTGTTIVELFRSSTPEFADYDRFRAQFPASNRDILLVVQGEVLSWEGLKHLRALRDDLQSSDEVAEVVSMLSIPGLPDRTGRAKPLIPEDPPRGEALGALLGKASEHPMIGGRLLDGARDDSQSSLLIVSLKEEANTVERQRASITAIDAAAQRTLEGTGLTYRTLGAPILEADLRDASDRSRILINSLALAVGGLVCIAFFRHWRPAAVAFLAPVVALTWTLGTLGWLDIRLSALLHAILPLVLAITFSDAMHLVFAMRRHMRSGARRDQAVRSAVLRVGPACVLTSLTTALAFASMSLTNSEVIANFAYAAAVCTLLALLSVLLMVPALGLLLLRERPRETKGNVRAGPDTDAFLDRLCAWIAGWVPRQRQALVLAGIVLTLGFLMVHLRLEPTFRLSDNLPAQLRASFAETRASAKLAIGDAVAVVVHSPPGAQAGSERLSELERAVQEALEWQPVLFGTWSLAALRRWAEDQAHARPEQLKLLMAQLPDNLVRRFSSKDQRSAVVTGYLPDLDARETLDVVSAIERRLEPLRGRYPGFQILLTGLPVLAATNSSGMVAQLNWSLLAAIVLVCVLLGAAFRSAWVALVSIVPNVLPLVSTGAALAVLGRGLDYASVTALTVAFGLAVDNTIHFLTRFREEARTAPTQQAAIAGTLSRIGPVLIATSLVLGFGMATTQVSELPQTQLFGQLCLGVLAVALLADLFLLPAIILASGNISPWRASQGSARSHETPGP